MLTLNWSIIWVFVNIIVLFLFLKKFLFKPVTAMLEKRTQTIVQSLEDAEAQKVEAEKLKNEYNEELSRASAEATKIVNAAREQATLEYDLKMKELKEEAARIMEESNKNIELERKKSIQSAQAEIATIALLATSKIIGRNVDSDTNKQMLGDFMKEVGVAK